MLNTMTAAEWATHELTPEEEAQQDREELQFCKGYWHAVLSCVEALEYGATLEQLGAYADTCQDWYDGDCTERVEPPAPPGS